MLLIHAAFPSSPPRPCRSVGCRKHRLPYYFFLLLHFGSELRDGCPHPFSEFTLARWPADSADSHASNGTREFRELLGNPPRWGRGCRPRRATRRWGETPPAQVLGEDSFHDGRGAGVGLEASEAQARGGLPGVEVRASVASW